MSHICTCCRVSLICFIKLNHQGWVSDGEVTYSGWSQQRVTGLSDDGTVASAFTDLGGGVYEAGIWVPADEQWWPVQGGGTADTAFGISGDGLTLVGASDGWPMRWTVDLLAEVTTFEDYEYGNATAVTHDGQVSVGYFGGGPRDGSDTQAFRWVGDSLKPLGFATLGGRELATRAYGVGADGTIVVGAARTFEGEPIDGFMWTEAQGMRLMRQVLTDDYGLQDEIAGWTLTNPYDVSEDGRFITGWGLDPNGLTQAFLIDRGGNISLREGR